MTYYCSDTHCAGRISLNLNQDSLYPNNDMTKCKNIKIIKEHSLPYNKHNYGRIKEIKSDIENLGTTLIVKKCKDYNYLVNFIKEIAIKNEIFVHIILILLVQNLVNSIILYLMKIIFIL